MAINIDEFTTELRKAAAKYPEFVHLPLLFNRLVDGTNQIASLTGVDASGHTTPPDAPTGISVKAANGNVHVVVSDNNQRNRALNYFVEASTDPSFPDQNTHTEFLGPGRSKFFSLPGLTDGNASQPWHFRTYSMQLGSSERSAVQTLGGSQTPTPVTVGGTTQLTPLPTTGSGTSVQSAQGFGAAQFSQPS